MAIALRIATIMLGVAVPDVLVVVVTIEDMGALFLNSDPPRLSLTSAEKVYECVTGMLVGARASELFQNVFPLVLPET